MIRPLETTRCMALDGAPAASALQRCNAPRGRRQPCTKCRKPVEDKRYRYCVR